MSTNPERRGPVSARFRAGDAVRVMAGRPSISLGRPHLRTPHYVRGKAGMIATVMGAFRNPEGLATGGDGLPMQVLYRVRFPQAVLWEGYRGPARDTLEVEIYEHWLEPADHECTGVPLTAPVTGDGSAGTAIPTA